jgi:hypothetical protein
MKTQFKKLDDSGFFSRIKFQQLAGIFTLIGQVFLHFWNHFSNARLDRKKEIKKTRTEVMILKDIFAKNIGENGVLTENAAK